MVPRPCLFVIAAALLSARAASATQHIVPDQFATIQSAIDFAAADDTVLIRTGEYHESLVIVGKALTLLGTGAETTILRPPDSSRVAKVGPHAGTSRLEGLTIAHGQEEAGAGVFVDSARCEFRSCWFYRNLSVNNGAGGGGGLMVGSGAESTIDGCVFAYNSSDRYGWTGMGGAIANLGHLETTRTRFVGNWAGGLEGGFGGAVYAEGFASFADCVFDSSSGAIGALYAWGELVVERCLFRWNYGAPYDEAGAIQFNGDRFDIRDCVFHDNGGAYIVQLFGGSNLSVFVGNTLAFNGARSCVRIQGTSDFRDNVVARNSGIGIDYSSSFEYSIECNDVWGNAGGEYYPTHLTGTDGNISADPMFCDSLGRDLSLQTGTPCIDETCGLMGALPVSCPVAGVTPVGSGSIRLLPVRPNPIREGASFGFVLPHAESVRLVILDVAGRSIATLADGPLPPGTHERHWSRPSHLKAGMYFVRLSVGRWRHAVAVVLL